MEPAGLPPQLVFYGRGHEEDSSSFCGRSYQQLFQGTIAFALFTTVVIAYATDLNSCRTDLISRSLIEVMGGACSMWMASSILMRPNANTLKSFFSDYATPNFLIFSQIFDNLTDETQKLVREPLFGFFNFYGGIVLAAFVHSVVMLRRAEGLTAPLVTPREDPMPKYKMLVDSSHKRVLFASCLSLLGAALLLSGSELRKEKLATDFGKILLGNGGARLLSELWWNRTLPSYSQHIQKASTFSSNLSFWIRSYTVINRVILATFHTLPGAFIVAAEVTKKTSPALSSTLFALTGVTIGWNEHLRQTRFTEVPKDALYEIQPKQNGILPKSFFGYCKWAIGFPGVMAFSILTIAGYNPTENIFQTPTPFVISSMTAFSVSLYASYAFSELARMRFSTQKYEAKWLNTAYYATHYSLGVPLIFLYIMEKLQINDEAINLDGPYAGILTTLAYGSLGLALGAEASGRFDFKEPRVVSALYFALFGRYFFNLLTRQENI